MNANEFATLAMAMKDIYTKPDFLDTDSKKKLWFDLLRDLDYETASKALRAYMSSERGVYEPKPADIRMFAGRAAKVDIPTAEEAWVQVRRAVRNSIYAAEEEFAKLPPLTQKTLGTSQTLRYYATQDSNTFSTATMFRFMKDYNILAQEARMDTSLPEPLKAIRQSETTGKPVRRIRTLAEGIRIESGTNTQAD